MSEQKNDLLIDMVMVCQHFLVTVGNEKNLLKSIELDEKGNVALEYSNGSSAIVTPKNLFPTILNAVRKFENKEGFEKAKEVMRGKIGNFLD